MRYISVEPPVLDTADRFPVLAADFVGAPRPTSPGTMIGEHPGWAKTGLVAMLVLGLALLWFVPLGGALVLATAGVGLAVSWEAQAGGPWRGATSSPAGSPPPSIDH